jgi:Protein of unknown function (DUF4238)
MLLRQWEDESGSGHLYILDRQRSDVPRRVRIDKVAVIKHFYTRNRDRPNREPDAYFEDLLAESESLAAPALERLLAHQPELAGAIIPWLYFQMLRTPQGQAAVADDYLTVIRDAAAGEGGLIPLWMDRKGRRPDPQEAMSLVLVSAAIATGRDHKMLHPGPTDMLNHMKSLVLHGDFGERLRDEGEWNTLSSDPDAFVLGDNPVTYTGQYDPSRPLWRQGRLPVQITMPIHPETCLEIRRSPRTEHLTFDEIDQMNLRTWHWSERWLFARSPNPLLRLSQLAESAPCRTPRPLTLSSARRR